MSEIPAKRSPIFPILLTVFVDFLGISLIIPLLAPLLLDPGDMLIGVDRETRNLVYGSLIACYSLFSFLFAPLLGKLSDRHGRKKVLSYSLFLTLAGYLVFATGIYMGELWLLFVGRSLSGIAAGNISVLYSAMADVSKPEEKAKNFGLVGAAFGSGFIIGPVLGGTLANSDLVPWFGYMTPFLFAAGLVVVNLVLVWVSFPETLKKFNKDAKFSLASGVQNLRKAFGNPKLRSIFMVTFLIGLGFTFFTEFIQPYLIDRYEYGEFEIGILFGFIGLWIVLTQGLILPKLVKKVKPKPLVLIFLPILAGSFLCMLIPGQGWGQYVVMPFVAIAYGIARPNITSMLSNSVPDDVQGEILGMDQSVNSLALLITPLIGGYVLNFGVRIPILIAAGAMFLAWITFGVRFGLKSDPEKAQENPPSETPPEE